MQAAQQNRLALRLAGCSDDYGVALSITGAAPAALIAIFKTFNGNAATGLAPAGVNVLGEAVFRTQRCAFVHEWCVDNVMPCNAASMCRALLQCHCGLLCSRRWQELAGVQACPHVNVRKKLNDDSCAVLQVWGAAAGAAAKPDVLSAHSAS